MAYDVTLQGPLSQVYLVSYVASYEHFFFPVTEKEVNPRDNILSKAKDAEYVLDKDGVQGVEGLVEID